MKKKILSMVLSLAVLCAFVPYTAGAETGGAYKDTMTWTLDAEGTLTISGTGVVAYEDDDLPWDENRSEIKQIILEEGITGIEGEWTFAGLENIKSVAFPESITVIGYEVFMNCPALTSVTIPSGVKEIGSRAFGLCQSLTEINVAENNPYFSSIDGVLCNKEQTEIIQFPIGRSDTSYTFPDSITSIRYAAFERDNNLTSIVFPDTIKSIGFYAFEGCENLADISIGNGVEEIGDGAFERTAYYTDKTKWENNVLYIDNCLIKATEEISGDYEIKSGTKAIAGGAFYNCGSLTGIAIPDSVVGIGESAFWNCKKITEIIMPQGVNKISKYMFYGCDNLTSVTIPDSVTVIDNNAFRFCRKLTSVEIPQDVTQIGDAAFMSCGLTDMTIPEGVTNIGKSAFSGCDLTGISVDVGNTHYISEDGILFNKAKTELIYYPNKKSETSYTIPDGIKSIGGGAFYSCKNLTEIIIPDSVVNIGDSAFYYCIGLTQFTIPDNVTSIGMEAFESCNKLELMTIGNGVKSIGRSAFSSCSALKTITIPDSVTDIGNMSFGYCRGLVSVTIGNGVKRIESDAFSSCDKLKDVYYNGTQEDWEKISIKRGNSDIESATKHYLSIPTPTPTVTPTPTPTPIPTPTPTPTPEPADKVEFERTGNTVSARLIFGKTTPPDESDIWLIAAYYENGILKRIEMPEVNKMTAHFSNTDSPVLVYVWDKNMKPLMQIQKYN